MISVGALVVLHDPHFAPMAALVEQKLSVFPEAQLRTQMRMPVALSVFLPMGVKGAFCAIALFGMIASLGNDMITYGATFVQDVIIPLRRSPMKPRNQILLLRLSALGIGLFAIVFGLWFKPQDYLMLIIQLIGAIYLCVGAVVWGGLYWKKGNNAGAWASMTIGAALAVAGLVAMQFWSGAMYPMLMSLAHHTRWTSFANYLAQHPDKCPLNAQILAVISFAGAGGLYFIVSFLTCRTEFNMDKLLHRGEYAVPELGSSTPSVPLRKSLWEKLTGVTSEYTRGDRVIATGTAIWTIVWKVAAVVIIVWNLAFFRWSDKAWVRWSFFQWVICEGLFGVAAMIWFTIGGTRDIIDLFRTIRTLKPDNTDNGMVADDSREVPSRTAEATPAELIDTAAEREIAPEVTA
jgi:SSS family solute:Na+ symporter